MTSGSSGRSELTGLIAQVLAGNKPCPACSPTPRATAATSSATGRAARRRPRHHAGRDHRHRRHAPGAAAQGRRPHAVLAHRRRPRGAALVAARVRVQRGDALPRRADDARAEPRRHRRAGDPRHVLRRQPAARARRGRLPRRALVRALRQFPDPRRPRRDSSPEAPRRLRRSASITRDSTYVELVPRSLPAHRAADGRLDAPGLRARRDEHRQHVDPRRSPSTTARTAGSKATTRSGRRTPPTRRTRRYAYGNQPQIAQWNLARLAEALLPLVGDKEPLEEGLALYAETFNAAWQRALAHKLGLAALDQPGDDELRVGPVRRCSTRPRPTSRSSSATSPA